MLSVLLLAVAGFVSIGVAYLSESCKPVAPKFVGSSSPSPELPFRVGQRVIFTTRPTRAGAKPQALPAEVVRPDMARGGYFLCCYHHGRGNPPIGRKPFFRPADGVSPSI